MSTTAKTESLASALAEFQSQLPAVVKSETATVPTKTGGSYKYSYADLPQINRIVLPLLGRLGLSFSAKPTINVGGKFVLAYRLLHTSGEEDCGEYPLPQSGTPQEYGSAITYARRYALCSVVGIAPDADDDGAAVNARPTNVAERQPPNWDPIEQDVLVTGYGAEIEDARDPAALTEIGKRIRRAKASGELSPASFDHLSGLGAKRRADFDQKAGVPA